MADVPREKENGKKKGTAEDRVCCRREKGQKRIIFSFRNTFGAGVCLSVCRSTASATAHHTPSASLQNVQHRL